MARSAAASTLPIGTFPTDSAASAAQRSATQAVLAVASTREGERLNAVVQAVSEAFSAEAESVDSAQTARLLDRDIKSLSGNDVSFLAPVPLWFSDSPDWAVQKWQDLKLTLHNAKQDWQVWTIWYDDRLDGRIRSFEHELAYVNITEDIWKQDPAVVNVHIVRRIEEHEPPPPIARPAFEETRKRRFSTREDVERWLEGKPPEWATVAAARAVLRSIPALGRCDESVVLAAFRTVLAAWMAAINPRWWDYSDLCRGILASNLSLSNFATVERPARTVIEAARFAIDTATFKPSAQQTFVAASAVDTSANAPVDPDYMGLTDEVWLAVESDAQALESGNSPRVLAARPLWHDGAPDSMSEFWMRLKRRLLNLNSDWKVWTAWFDARLEGEPMVRTLEIARVSIADKIWKQGPRAVNAEVARRIEDHRRRDDTSTPEIGVDTNDALAGWQLAIIDGPNLPMSDWADASVVFEQGSRTDLLQGERLSAALEAADAESRIAHYISVFLTADGAPRKNLISRGLAGPRPEFKERLTAERNRLVELSKRRPSSKVDSAAARNWDFFLSYSGDDLAFARWIEAVLSTAGFRVFAQFNNMPPGSNFVREMQRGLAQSARFIALLSPAYQRSDHCQAEWSAAYNADPGGRGRKLVPFLIAPAQLDPLAKQIVYKPLIGLSPADATKAVLEAVDYRGRPPTVPPGWPSGAAIDRMQAATGGVYEVAPGSDLRLERIPGVVNDLEDGGHTSEHLFTDAVSVVVRFSNYVERRTGNNRCSDRLTTAARNLSCVVAGVDVRHCDYLGFHRELVWVLRMITLDSADGLIPKNDEIEYHASDLLGIYNRLPRIFPKLRDYREMEARDRFQLPDTDSENALRSVCRAFGNPEIAGDALSPHLSEELKQAGEEVENAKKLAETESISKTLDINLESHADAATRSLSVWGWLSNPGERLVKAGKKAEDVGKAIEGYEKLYDRLAPEMGKYIEYLLKWFF